MGEIKSRWCFTSVDRRRRYCAIAKVDTGATAFVLPERQAQRIGVTAVSLGLPDPGPMRDAQQREIPGAWYVIGEARAMQDEKQCRFSPVVLVYGQRNRTRRPVIGVKPLQDVGATLRLARGGDTYECDKTAVRRAVGAALNLRRLAVKQAREMQRALRKQRR